MLLVKEEKALLKKVTRAVGHLIKKANLTYTDKEICELTKVPTNRLTEYKNFKKYGRSITMDNVVKLLFGGIITMPEVTELLKETEGLTTREEAFLKEMNLFGVTEFRKRIIRNEQLGIDQIAVQTLIGELKEAGIDPVEALKKIKKGG